MSPRLLWLSVLPILALQPALSRAADPAPFAATPMARSLRQAEDLARKASEDLMRSLEQLRAAIPLYGTPYFDDDGNIVIPRRNGPGTPVPPLPPTRA